MNRLRPLVPASCIAASLLLAACGGSKGVVVWPAMPPPQPLQPPSRPAWDPCPPPDTSDCEVSLDEDESRHLPATSSDHALVLLAGGSLALRAGNYRFEGGTRVEGGHLDLDVTGRLASHVEVGPGGLFSIWGTVDGDVHNLGRLFLGMRVTGDLRNDGRMEMWSAQYGNIQTVEGDFIQSGEGTLAFALAPEDWQGSAPLHVAGSAQLAGALEFVGFTDQWRQYALPKIASHHVIHADGGVSGRFAQWSSTAFAITGDLRYEDNDVWFDLERISMASALHSNGLASARRVRAAANLDHALAIADGFALDAPGALDEAQRRFLASAASIMWLRDDALAARTFDSLAGHGHAALGDVLQRRAEQAGSRLAARLERAAHATSPAAWSAQASLHPLGQSVDDVASGVDLWLSPRLLLGGSLSSGDAWMRFDALGGGGQAQLPMASVYAHYRGDGWHATGAVGAAQGRMRLQRPIQAGESLHLASADRRFGQVSAHGEVGRALSLGEVRVVPFAALDYGQVRGDGFVESGPTGFELAAGPSRQSRLSGAVGTRIARDWRGAGWSLGLSLEARYRYDLVDAEPLAAAFRGVPGAVFALPQEDRDGVELGLGLSGAGTRGLRWWFDYGLDAGAGRDDRRWMLGLRRGF